MNSGRPTNKVHLPLSLKEYAFLLQLAEVGKTSGIEMRDGWRERMKRMAQEQEKNRVNFSNSTFDLVFRNLIKMGAVELCVDGKSYRPSKYGKMLVHNVSKRRWEEWDQHGRRWAEPEIIRLP